MEEFQGVGSSGSMAAQQKCEPNNRLPTADITGNRSTETGMKMTSMMTKGGFKTMNVGLVGVGLMESSVQQMTGNYAPDMDDTSAPCIQMSSGIFDSALHSTSPDVDSSTMFDFVNSNMDEGLAMITSDPDVSTLLDDDLDTFVDLADYLFPDALIDAVPEDETAPSSTSQQHDRSPTADHDYTQLMTSEPTTAVPRLSVDSDGSATTPCGAMSYDTLDISSLFGGGNYLVDDNVEGNVTFDNALCGVNSGTDATWGGVVQVADVGTVLCLRDDASTKEHRESGQNPVMTAGTSVLGVLQVGASLAEYTQPGALQKFSGWSEVEIGGSVAESLLVQDRKQAGSVEKDCLADTQKYRQRRDKNNKASKNSRETRKRKYLDMEEEANKLEEENEKLRGRMVILEKVVEQMRADLITVVSGRVKKK